ncbi:MAG: hypothetical protein RIT14_1692, partial [Pseudomonadota bacterium]
MNNTQIAADPADLMVAPSSVEEFRERLARVTDALPRRLR